MDQVITKVIGGAPAEAETATTAVLAALKQGSLSVLGLVSLLQLPLTDDVNHEARAKAVQLLSQVAADAPEALQPGDVGVLADFLGSKLSDWRCVAAAVPGCLALLQRHKQDHLAPLPQPAALQLVGCVVKVHVQGLDYRGRLACYELLLELLQGPLAQPAVLSGGYDLVLFTLVAMENEADPRCLLVALQCVEAVGKLYHQPELVGVTHLQDNLEDFFDVCVVPYFPVVFNAPKNDVHRITREMLLQRVIAAMACCPEFAALAIPVLSEKLGSSLRQSKEDSLTALPVCLKGWGAAAVKPHLQAVWLMLKPELMAPSAVEDSKQQEQLIAKQAMAAQAALALQHSIAALGPGLLDQQVLNDVAVEDLQQYLGLVNPPWATAADAGTAAAAVGSGSAGPGQGSSSSGDLGGWHLPGRAQRRLACIAACVAAVTAAGGASCAAACGSVLRPAVEALLQDTRPAGQRGASDGSAGVTAAAGRRVRPLQANCGVLAVMHPVLQAVAAAAGTAPAGAAQRQDPEPHTYAALTALVPQLVSVLDQLQVSIVQGQQQGQEQLPVSASGLQVSQYEEALQLQQLQLWVLLLWQDLLLLPPSITQLQQAQLVAAAEQLLPLALHGSSTDTPLELAPGTTAAEQAAAAAALTLMAGWQHSPAEADEAAADSASGLTALDGCAQQLLQLLQGQAGGSGPDGQQQARASSLLAQLAGSSSAAAWQVLLWLRPLVLRQAAGAQLEGLCCTLPILCNSSVPALPKGLPPTQSAEAADICAAFMQACQQQPAAAGLPAAPDSIGTSDSVSRPGGGISSRTTAAALYCCLFAGQLAAACSLEHQRQLLLLPACAWVMQVTALSPAVAGSAMNVDKAGCSVLVCVPLAVIAGGRPGLLAAGSAVDVLQAAAALAVQPALAHGCGNTAWITSTAAAAAVAATINKVLGRQNQQQQAAAEASQPPAAAAVAPARVDPEVLLSTVLPVLTHPLLSWQQQQQLSSPETAGDREQTRDAAVRAVAALSRLARGLAMQRHDGWRDIMRQHILPLLTACTPWQQDPAAQAEGGQGGASAAAASPTGPVRTGVELAWAAAQFFSVLVAASGPAAGPSVSAPSSACKNSGSRGSDGAELPDAVRLAGLLGLHCMSRPLWQQKAFVLALEELQAAAGAAAGSAAGSDGSKGLGRLQDGAAVQQGLWLAIASLLSAAPGVLQVAGVQLVLLLQCLVHLLGAWNSQVACQQHGDVPLHISGSNGVGHLPSAPSKPVAQLLQLMHSCLLMLGDALAAQGQAAEELSSHAELLLHTLSDLAQLTLSAAAGAQYGQAQRRHTVQQAASVREVSLMCLTSCMALPYHLLHPHRRTVLAAVSRALDDDKRVVRRAAVVCRGAWSSSC